jgi:hypothetical protein
MWGHRLNSELRNNMKSEKISKISVIGPRTMGANIAGALAGIGCDVRVYEIR